MDFLNSVDVGDRVWVRNENVYGATEYIEDVIISKLKTRIKTKNGETFMIDNGESLSNTESNKKQIVEFTTDVENAILDQEYQSLLLQMSQTSFRNNALFKSFIKKLKNLYDANSGI